MLESNPRWQVIPFPTPTGQRFNHAAKRAVRLLLGAGLVTEAEAVRSLEDWGAHPDEIEPTPDHRSC